MATESAREPGWMVSIILYFGDDDRLRVWSVETLFNGVKHRMTFSRSNIVNDIFFDGISEQFRTICDRLTDSENSFLVIPDLEVSRGPMRLVGLRGLRTEARNGRRQLNLRFKYFVGTLQELMRVRMPFNNPIMDHREKIAVEALSDITAPLLGMASLDEKHEFSEGQTGLISAKLSRISDRASDLQFYLTLLVRYVRECTESFSTMQGRNSSDIVRLQTISDGNGPNELIEGQISGAKK